MTLSPMEPLAWRTVVARCQLGSTVKLVAYTLANYASPDGRDVRPGGKRLLRDTELGDRTIRDALAKLREVGLVERVFCASAAGLTDLADEYRLTMPDDLDHRVAVWDPQRKRLTKAGVEVEPPKPKTRAKRAKPPATPADGGQPPATDADGSEAADDQAPASPADGSAPQSDQPPATPAGAPVDNSVPGTPSEAPENPLPDGNHRQLVPEPPATGTGTTGRSCRPPSHAPSQSPSHHTSISPYGAEVEGGSVDRREASPEIDHGVEEEDRAAPPLEADPAAYAAASAYFAGFEDLGSAWITKARAELGDGTPLAAQIIHAHRLATRRAGPQPGRRSA